MQLPCILNVARANNGQRTEHISSIHRTRRRVLEGFTPLLYSPIGLDLKLAKRALKMPLSRDALWTILIVRGDNLRFLRGRFRSSPVGLYSKGLNPSAYLTTFRQHIRRYMSGHHEQFPSHSSQVVLLLFASKCCSKNSKQSESIVRAP